MSLTGAAGGPGVQALQRVSQGREEAMKELSGVAACRAGSLGQSGHTFISKAVAQHVAEIWSGK